MDRFNTLSVSFCATGSAGQGPVFHSKDKNKNKKCNRLQKKDKNSPDKKINIFETNTCC